LGKTDAYDHVNTQTSFFKDLYLIIYFIFKILHTKLQVWSQKYLKFIYKNCNFKNLSNYCIKRKNDYGGLSIKHVWHI